MSDSAIATSSTTPAKAKTKKNRLSGSFFRFVLTRFLLIIPTVFILVTIVFFVMRATGDPISAALGGRLTPAELQQRIHAAGYDRPLIVQYVDYLGGLLHGDLGTTLTDNQPVISILTAYAEHLALRVKLNGRSHHGIGKPCYRHKGACSPELHNLWIDIKSGQQDT